MKMKLFFSSLTILLLLFTACNSKDPSLEKKHQIEQILHQGNKALWGLYDKNFTNMGISFLIAKDGVCLSYDEIMSDSIVDFWKVTTVQNIYDARWSVEIGNYIPYNTFIENIYIRCQLYMFKVLIYNGEYFKLLTNEGNIVYLYKSKCQSEDCRVPKKIAPAPW